jgi:chemotaxis protein MotA
MRKFLHFLRHNYRNPPVIGAGFALMLVLSPIAMGGHTFLILFSLAGLVIVVGGVITTAFMSFDPKEVHKALDAITRMFREKHMQQENLHADITAIVYCARLMQEQKGTRNLEAVITRSGIRDPFLKYGLNMVVSDYTSDDVRGMLEIAAEAAYERDSVPVEILQAMTSHGPAFGMVGTLVGMVAMLCNLTDNVTDIGPSLAVAFLSTLYGVLSARLLYIPAASRLRREVDQKRFQHYLITEGMAMLVARKSPMYVQDRLNGFLRPESYDYFDVTKRTPAAAPAPVAQPAAKATMPAGMAATVAA